MEIKIEVNCCEHNDLECCKRVLNDITDRANKVVVKHDESNEERYLDALDVFLGDFCGTNPSDNDDEWVFDALARCRMEHELILQLKALFAMFPDFFESVKSAKDSVCGKNVCPHLFLPLEGGKSK